MRGVSGLVAVVASLVWPQEMLQRELYAEFSTADPTQGISAAPWAVRDSTVGWGVVMTFFVIGVGIKELGMQLLCLPGPGPPSPPPPPPPKGQGRGGSCLKLLGIRQYFHAGSASTRR